MYPLCSAAAWFYFKHKDLSDFTTRCGGNACEITEASMKTAGTVRLKLVFNLSTELYTFKICNENPQTIGLLFLVTLHRSKGARVLSAGVWEQALFLCMCFGTSERGQVFSRGISIQLQTKLPTLPTCNAKAPRREKILNWDAPGCFVEAPTTLLPSSPWAAASSPLQAEVFQDYQVCATRQVGAPLLWTKGATLVTLPCHPCTCKIWSYSYTNAVWVSIQAERPHTNKNRSLQLTATGIRAQQAQKVSTAEHY